jgi:hypothetical protein
VHIQAGDTRALLMLHPLWPHDSRAHSLSLKKAWDSPKPKKTERSD